ncbi:pre-rRNA processing protein [Malassezia cuniculi]|uniref:Pre-rRNA processing protein n=1 Tax=Malassezia cuniculi TaxID=948313 RepID=A0AAF0END5_9BASI|nr:pre-rRNA processing protein [Malassezia cuniculi]
MTDDARAALGEALLRIRQNANSKLENQRAPAQLLVAVEATLAERGDGTGPTQYLLALESLLGAAEESSSVFASAVYLLAVVLPHVSPGVVRAKGLVLLSAVAQPLANPHTQNEGHAALLRAALGCVECIFGSIDASEQRILETERAYTAAWGLVLSLCVDARPKVRRRAHELVEHELTRATWQKGHPYAQRTIAWAVHALSTVAGARGVADAQRPTAQYDKKTGRAQHASRIAAQRQDAADGAASTGIWTCALLRATAPAIPAAAIESLAGELLRLPGLRNPFLTVAAFDVFEALFRASHASSTSDARILRATLDALKGEALVPPHTDVQTLPSYLRVVEAGMVAFSRMNDGKDAWALVPTFWGTAVDLGLDASSDASRASADVRSAAGNLLLALVRYCIPDSAIASAQSGKDALVRLISQLRDALGKHALRFVHVRTEVLQVIAALLQRLRHVDGAAELVLDIVEHVAQLRSQRDFDARPAADGVIGAAIASCGPKAVLERLPLGLLDAAGRPNAQGGRAWLLPILREHISNTYLGYFVSEFVPLSERLFELRVGAENPANGKPRPVEAKVFEALIEQLWACFPGFCDLARDMTDALTSDFVSVLINVVSTQSALRSSILRGLQLLVERNEVLAASSAPSADLRRDFGLDQEDGKRNMAHLRALAGQLLLALFNLVAELPAQSRGYVIETIGTLLRTLDHDGITAIQARVTGLLEQSLTSHRAEKPTRGAPEANSPRYIPPVPHTMLDLLIVMVPFVDASGASKLFELANQDALLASTDSGLQKKAYRILARLIGGKHGSVAGADSVSLLGRLNAAPAQSGAVRDRLQLLGVLVPLVPDDQLHVLMTLTPEAVLGTKEANQGAREVAYELLVTMCTRMTTGGTIDRSAAVEGEKDEEMYAPVAASANEYILMVAAGLAGASARMISASITALARLVYEFHTVLPPQTLEELVATMAVYLESANREIIKSALGFVKVAVVVLDGALIERMLPTVVPAVFGIRAEHKHHFKGRIRHLVERLIRRFGVAAVEALVDEDNKRLVTNIRKRKERARRRRADAAGGDDAAEQPDSFRPAAGSGAMDAFEEALYGSASDTDGSDDDEAAPAASARGKASSRKGGRGRENDAYLVEDDDAPLDLLDESAVGAIQSGSTRRRTRRQPGAEAAMFAVDDEGRMRIEDEDGNERDAGAAEAQDSAKAMEGAAYMERAQGVDGFTFKRGGAVKFNKNNKRSRANERMDEDDDADGAKSSAPRPKPAKRQKEAVGAEFRSRRAGGDMTRGGVSPYAYVPLASIAGKRNARKGPQMKIAGKTRK